MAGAAGGFVTRSFESMLKECSGKKYAVLHKAIQAYLDCAREAGRQPDALGSASEDKDGVQSSMPLTTALASAGNALEGAQAELVLQPLRLAFETKNVKLVDAALDCLHKLIAYDHLEGDPGIDGGKNASLFADILTMVCGCIDDSSSDSTILQVLKVLLTAVASTKFRVHGEPLLGVIRLCYNISLNSKSPVNQATSKAMLTQMISIIFRRMESDQVSLSSISSSEHISSGSHSTYANSGQLSAEEIYEEKAALEDTINQGKEGSSTSIEELQNLASGADIKVLEAILDNAVSIEDGKKLSRGIDLNSVSIGQRDALLVFRTLCKMGMKEENDDATTKTRLLSLELLQGLLEGVSHSFTKNFHFIDSVKSYLCYAVLRASVSPLPSVFQFATGIFAALLLRFRESLKGEIAIFFPLIVLRSLDFSDSLTSQRASVLRMLEKVCKDPQTLADIFVNYDCDLEGPNLFERMVNSLSKIAQGSQNAEPNSVAAAQATSIKTSSLQCLVNVLKSLVDWEKSWRRAVDYTSVGQISQEETSAQKSLIMDENRSGGDELNQFETAKAPKSTLEAAISEFNHKPGKGLELLILNKLVDKSAASVAQFLRNTPGLDKALIGEYLGQHEEFPVSVMHAYVDSMKFSGLRFDVAIREFLQGFWLPGEAQKIDRIMEKFAERYCAKNPEIFRNADTAYVLAYAVIMLNTDVHNTLVSPRMSKSDFIQMNSMSDGEERAPKELLEEIYDSIVKEKIQMKSDTSNSGKSNRQRPEREDMGHLISILNLALPRKKSISDTKIKSEQAHKMQALFRDQGVKKGAFYVAQHVELARPMLEAVGWPLLAAFSVIMEEVDDKIWILLCMEGLKGGIHITWALGMDTMHYAFLTSLVRYTFLHSPKKLCSKNVEALRTLLSLGDTEIDTLQDTWNAVLECISRLEFITSTPSVAATVMHGLNQISRDSVLQSMRELAGRPLEQVFVNSVKLSSDSVVEFFTALCCVSAEELKQTPPRVFSLQKLVEISYYNMARIRLVWARIWSVLAQHFISAGSHHDEKIATYAINSLRQLGMKYLERAELSNFTFQNDILKPFVVLMRNCQNQSIRGLIVDCIVQMIKSEVGSIKSGWQSVFMIFAAAADDNLESTTESAFENVEQVILEHFDQVAGDCFMDCVDCLIRFANNKSSVRISLKAIALLRICENRLAEGSIPVGPLKPSDAGVDSYQDVSEHYWFAMLVGLSDLTFDSRLQVRNCALEVLFDFLNERGSMFSSAFWKNIFNRVLFPIFDQVRHAGKDGTVSSGDDSLRDTIIHSLQLLCNLFNTFYKEVSFMLPPLLNLLLDCAKKADQSVVSISLGALVHLIEVGGHKFSDVDWDTLLQSLRDASYTTQPLELLNLLELGEMKGRDVLAKDIDVEKNDNSTLVDTASDATDSGRTLDQLPLKDSTESAGKVADTSGYVNSTDDPEGSRQKAPGSESPRKNLRFGSRIMGNMMDSILIRSLTSKSKAQPDDVPVPPTKVLDTVEPEPNDDDGADPLLETVRVKCMAQLLLLGALDCIQKKYWIRLKHPQKMAIMDILLSLLEFAASYNSFGNLQKRIHETPSERPPLNLLRQEIAGTSIYLDILQKSMSGHDNYKVDHVGSDDIVTGSNTDEILEAEKALKNIAEEKLVSFCGQILKEASEMQQSVLYAETVDVHRVLELRAPVTVKVLRGMSLMNNHIFQKHLKKFYPLITKLICCEQMDVRGALGDLFSMQLTSLLP